MCASIFIISKYILLYGTDIRYVYYYWIPQRVKCQCCFHHGILSWDNCVSLPLIECSQRKTRRRLNIPNEYSVRPSVRQWRQSLNMKQLPPPSAMKALYKTDRCMIMVKARMPEREVNIQDLNTHVLCNIHPRQDANCCRNPRLVVGEDDSHMHDDG